MKSILNKVKKVVDYKIKEELKKLIFLKKSIGRIKDGEIPVYENFYFSKGSSPIKTLKEVK